jgi:hypothetical protein
LAGGQICLCGKFVFPYRALAGEVVLERFSLTGITEESATHRQHVMQPRKELFIAPVLKLPTEDAAIELLDGRQVRGCELYVVDGAVDMWVFHDSPFDRQLAKARLNSDAESCWAVYFIDPAPVRPPLRRTSVRRWSGVQHPRKSWCKGCCITLAERQPC